MKLSKFAKGSVALFFFLYLVLILSGVWVPDLSATLAVAGLTWGHILLIAIHVFAVVAAWIHIKRAAAREESSE